MVRRRRRAVASACRGLEVVESRAELIEEEGDGERCSRCARSRRVGMSLTRRRRRSRSDRRLRTRLGRRGTKQHAPAVVGAGPSTRAGPAHSRFRAARASTWAWILGNRRSRPGVGIRVVRRVSSPPVDGSVFPRHERHAGVGGTDWVTLGTRIRTTGTTARFRPRAGVSGVSSVRGFENLPAGLDATGKRFQSKELGLSEERGRLRKVHCVAVADGLTPADSAADAEPSCGGTRAPSSRAGPPESIDVALPNSSGCANRSERIVRHRLLYGRALRRRARRALPRSRLRSSDSRGEGSLSSVRPARPQRRACATARAAPAAPSALGRTLQGAEGCDRACAFCAIPSSGASNARVHRMRFRSRGARHR